MTPDDLQEVMEIETTTQTPWSAELIAAELKLAYGWQYVFQHRETSKILGFIVGTLIIDEAEIRKIAVRHECRRQKIASLLLIRSLAFLKEKKAASCFLELRKSNKAAFSLYGKQGFAMVGERENYYNDPAENALIMKKPLQTGETLEKH